MGNPWDATHRIAPETARKLAKAAFGIDADTLTPLGEGFDFINFLADERWVLRFPKRDACEQALLQEYRTLQHIHALGLAIAVPRYEALSPPMGDFPWHFGMYPLIVGTPLSAVRDPALIAEIAPALGEWLAALHASAPQDIIQSPWDQPSDTRAQLFEACREIFPPSLLNALTAFARETPPPMPDAPHVLAHADLGAEHILVNPETRSLCGIIDWGDACTSLRTLDFVGLYLAGGPAAVASAFTAYGATPTGEEWAWLRYQAIAAGIESVYYRARTGRADAAKPFIAQLDARLVETA